VLVACVTTGMRCDPRFVQPNTGEYSVIAIEQGKLFLDIYHNAIANSQAKIPGYLPMVGGPAFGPNALAKIIEYFGWKKVALYLQNDPQDVITASTFTQFALAANIIFALQKREGSTAAALEQDYKDLLAVETNVFIFFGGAGSLTA